MNRERSRLSQRRSVVPVVADSALVSEAGALKFETLNHSEGVRPPEGAALGSPVYREAAGPHALAAARAHRKRLAAVQGENPVDLPVTERDIYGFVHAGAKLLAPAEREIVGKARSEVVADVPCCVRIVQAQVSVADALKIIRAAERGAAGRHGMAQSIRS